MLFTLALVRSTVAVEPSGLVTVKSSGFSVSFSSPCSGFSGVPTVMVSAATPRLSVICPFTYFAFSGTNVVRLNS